MVFLLKDDAIQAGAEDLYGGIAGLRGRGSEFVSKADWQGQRQKKAIRLSLPKEGSRLSLFDKRKEKKQNKGDFPDAYRVDPHPLSSCESGGTGRRAGLRIQWGNF